MPKFKLEVKRTAWASCVVEATTEEEAKELFALHQDGENWDDHDESGKRYVVDRVIELNDKGEEITIECANCGWKGSEEDLEFIENLECTEDSMEACPKCKTDENLMDIN